MRHESEPHYRALLKRELETRCERNVRYSLRAFARDLGVSSSRLSEVLNGRYGLSREAAQTIALKLGWNDHETSNFCDLVDAEHARGKLKKSAAKARVESRPQDYQQLSLDSFQVVSDWYHYALLELCLVANFQSNSAWIAKKLGISIHQADGAIERLKRLDLLEEKDGRLSPTDGFTASPSGIPSDAIKKFHKQLLEKAMNSIYLQGVDERDLSHMVLAVNQDQIPEAKEEIRKFRRSFDAKFSKAEKKDEVYCLGISFFRLQEKTDET